MTASLLPNGKQQYFDAAGDPLVGGKVYTYAAGTSTPKATYQDSAATITNTNPIILDSRGEAVVFWSGDYKVVLKDSLENTIYTVDNLTDFQSTVDAKDTQLRDDLASNTDAAKGAGMSGWDYDLAYAADTTGWKLNLEARDVEEFGASTSGTATANATAIQSAFNWLRDNGGVLRFKPNGTYLCNAALTLLLDSSAKAMKHRVVDFRGCTIDWSASGLTTGTLLTVGATAIGNITEVYRQVFRGPLRMLGPQSLSGGSTRADFPWMNNPSTTVVGLRTQYAQNYLFEAIVVQACFIGRQRFWTWDDTWINCLFRQHFYAEETQEACTTGTHVQCAFTYSAIAHLFRVADTSGSSVSAQGYQTCRAEQCHAIAAFDPGNTSGGGVATDVQFNGISFRDYYVEAMSDYDLIRVGTKVVNADIIANLTAGTPSFPSGADQNKYTMNIVFHCAKFNHTLTANSKLFAMPTSDNKCFGFDVMAPAHPITDVRNSQKMQSKRWLMLHSKTNIAGQAHEDYSSNTGSMIIEGNTSPPTVLSQNGNLESLIDWPSALGGGGTLATGNYKVSVRENVYSSSVSHHLVGTCGDTTTPGVVTTDYAGSGRTNVVFVCKDMAGAAFNPSRISIQWRGITGEV